MSGKPWTWETGTPMERADAIRMHMQGSRPLSFAQTAEMFNLTDAGLQAILKGQPWRAQYDRDGK